MQKSANPQPRRKVKVLMNKIADLDQRGQLKTELWDQGRRPRRGDVESKQEN